ncbi:uncharacterized protein BDW47DRAFT_68255 [Aspergillus candidus]|uniref:Uncharacterized protein n=1 Tax=Aspergillus candidus TaxID=41067 RepID=A0A2I2F3A3_ASPCN|nr:hypothetical protein BDW47DRAFT_68255 [Aspergillus candidus]PLB35089.1 hypothetical protein BDW47DRAFT_68255 [Aspergillus candidus]
MHFPRASHQVGSSVPSVIKSFRFAVAVHVDGLNASKEREKKRGEKKEKLRKRKPTPSRTPRKKINVKAMMEG